MPTILAIDTSAESASAALLIDDRLLTRESSGVATHSHTILPMVQALLAEAGIALAGCQAIAFGSGPGSFTGVRTACGIAQGLAFGAGLPVVPVVTLMAMAERCRDAGGASDVTAVLDARMGEVYWAQYRFDNGWRTIVEPTLSLPAGVAADGGTTLCGNGLTAYAAAFRELSPRAAMPDIMPHAGAVAALARTAFLNGHAVPARDARPLYLRNKVALTTEERLAKAAA